MKSFKFLLSVILSISMLGIVSDDAFARRSGSSRSSFSRSSSSSRSTPSKTPSKSTWGNTRKSTANTRSTTKPKRSQADQKLHDKAKANGTAYTSKASATKAFKEKNASQYKSTYSTKPTSRPSHIPESTSVGGKSYNVTYNQQHGGYGYMGASGSWMMYNTMTDIAMISLLMSRNNYYYDTVPISSNPVVSSNPVAVVRHNTSAGVIVAKVLLAVLIICILVAIIGVICKQ